MQDRVGDEVDKPKAQQPQEWPAMTALPRDELRSMTIKVSSNTAPTPTHTATIAGHT